MTNSGMSTSLKTLAIRGTLWTIAGYGAGQVLRFGSNLILTRLLMPELFGLMSLVYVFIIGLNLFSDIGLGTNIVQSQRGDDPKFLNTAWTIQIIRGIGLWACCLILAVPAANLYNEPKLLWLLPIVGLNTILSAFNSTSLYTLNRNLSVRELAIFELGWQATSVVVMVAWAMFDRSIWALIVGGFASNLVQLFWSHRLNSATPNRLCMEAEARREIISFGKWIFLSTALTFLATQADRIVLAKLFSFELLGIYGIAFALADIPKQVAMALSGKVVLPAFSKFAQLPRQEFCEKSKRGRQAMLIFAACVVAVIVSFGDIVVRVLYDYRYAAAAWMLPILALGVWPAILNSTLGPALFAIGNPRYAAYASFWGSLALILGMIVGFQSYGVLGAVTAVAFSNIPYYLVSSYGLWREKLVYLDQDAKASLLLIALVVIFMAGRVILGYPPLLPASIGG